MSALELLVAVCVAGAFVPMAAIGVTLLVGSPLSERRCQQSTYAQALLLFLTASAMVAAHVLEGGGAHEVRWPPLLEFHGYTWTPVFLIDRLSLAYLMLSALVYPVVVRFSIPSFHREPGAARYWFLVTLLAFGLVLVSLSGNIDVLYVGWELVGLCSVSLIAFFRHNPRSAENSLRALIYYRVCDAGLLASIVWIHHAFPSADFLHFHDDSRESSAATIGLLLLFSSLAKSAQLPMSPWLHRAMEGPATSSAIFYGALSVHLGPLLLLRTAPLWLEFSSVRLACIGVGASTAVYATLVGRARSDAKTAIAYATMAQLGVIYVEIGLGLHTLALVHLWAHAGLRTWQFLRSSSLIQDFQANPLVGADVRLRARSGAWTRFVPRALERRVYFAALRLFWLDALQWRAVARPLLGVFGAAAAFEERVLGPKRRIGG